LRKTLLALLAAGALFCVVPSYASQHTKKSSKAQKQSKKEAAQDEGNAQAPDKVLYDRAMHDIKKGHQEIARLTLQTLINTYPDSEYLAKAKLAIADSYFKEGGSANLAQAIAAYQDFQVFFPFLPEAAYAQMQVAKTHFREMAKPDRDRSEALAAEDAFQTFLLKYPHDPQVPQAQQDLRDVQEILAEGDFRVGYYYYLKGDRRAAAGRLFSVTKRYPLYSKSDKALWMLGDIFEKSERKDIAGTYYAKIVRDYPLSPLVKDAKQKLVAFGMPVPQPDPKALAWMEADARAPRPHSSFMSKPLALVRTGPHKELETAARTGEPNLSPDTDTYAGTDILNPGGVSRIGAGGSSGATGNTAIVEIATPGSGASGGSSASTPNTPAATDPTATTNSSEPGSGAEGGSDVAPTPAPTPAPSGTADANAQPAANSTATPATQSTQQTKEDGKKVDKKKESSSKKKKGLRKLIPW
jgi:outer membrane protein assembly factor BamD